MDVLVQKGVKDKAGGRFYLGLPLIPASTEGAALWHLYIYSFISRSSSTLSLSKHHDLENCVASYFLQLIHLIGRVVRRAVLKC